MAYEGMCCRLADRGRDVGADLMLDWCSSDLEIGFVAMGSEVWHGGIWSVGGD